MIADADIRLAEQSDAPEIAAMSRQYIEYGLPWRWTPGRVAKSIRDPDTNAAVVQKNGKLVAFGIMSYRREDAHLLLLAVHHQFRRSGLGSAVLVWLEETARIAGSARIVVEARIENVAARSMYSEHGYHEQSIERAMYSGRADGVHLEKWLRVED